MSQATYITDATTETFEQEVLKRSAEVPVIVDFWATWCAPCKTLAPLLEQAVAKKGGAVWLVKVDTDQNQELAGAAGIRNIPTIKAFVNGQLVDEFTGVLSKEEVEAFVDRLCPTAEEASLTRATASLEAGEPQGVEEVLAPALASPHHRDLALLILARARAAQGNTDLALAALDEVDADSLVAEEVDRLRVSLEMAGAAGAEDEAALSARIQTDPKDLDAHWALAGLLQAAGKEEQALDELLEIVKLDREYRDDGARRAILAILDGLGPDSDLARDVRGMLMIYL